MENLTFGKKLNKLRSKCRHPQTGKLVTQIQFAEYLYEELGTQYTGTAISDWERSESIINVKDRLLLISIIKVLKKYGGITSLSQANDLLESGDYRALNSDERKILFPETIEIKESKQIDDATEKDSLLKSFTKNMFFDSPEEFKSEWENVKKGPPPAWPRLLVSIIRKRTDRISPTHVSRLILWVWVFVVAYWLIVPSFQLPFTTKQSVFEAMSFYVVGTFVLPFFIGLMVSTKDNPFWKEQNLQNSVMLRLYVFQGAYVGFHVTYFLAFLIIFIAMHFQIQFALWVEILILLGMIAFSYASAYLVPYNLWLAYQRLALKDGWIFFIFVFVGPLWAWFFLEFYEMLTSPVIGIILILSALTLVVIREVKKKNQNQS